MTKPIYIKLKSFWISAWSEYLKKHDSKSLLADLNKGVDEISVEYLTRIVWLYERFFDDDKLYEKIELELQYAWCSEDLRKAPLFEQFVSEVMPSIEAKYHLPGGMYNHYLFFNKFCLDEVEADIFSYIKGKTIIDGGAFVGDSALMFYDNYEPKNIIAFEPSYTSFEILKLITKNNNLKDVIIPVFKGLGDKPDSMRLRNTKADTINPVATFSTSTDNLPEVGEEVEISTIDLEVSAGNYEVGLIKLDIEGFEKKAIEGALETIKRDKPVLIISIYHNPVDFFEIKPLLESLDLGYKFMVRRAEALIPLGDIILIAY